MRLLRLIATLHQISEQTNPNLERLNQIKAVPKSTSIPVDLDQPNQLRNLQFRLSSISSSKGQPFTHQPPPTDRRQTGTFDNKPAVTPPDRNDSPSAQFNPLLLIKPVSGEKHLQQHSSFHLSIRETPSDDDAKRRPVLALAGVIKQRSAAIDFTVSKHRFPPN